MVVNLLELPPCEFALPKGIPAGIDGHTLRWCWTYRDAERRILGHVVRYDSSAGKKTILPYFCSDNGTWLAGYPAGPRSLFGLDSLRPDSTVFVVEGERCAAALHQLGLAAVTSPGGSNAARLADWTSLDGCSRVVILPDNDTPGETYASDVSAALDSSMKAIRKIEICRLSGLPSAGDVVDWIQALCVDWDGFSEFLPAQIDSIRDQLMSEIAGRVEVVGRPEPIPLRREPERPEPYPIDALGEVLGGAAIALHENIKAPVAICTQSVLTAASMAVQSHADVFIDGRCYPLSLWFISVAESGERKTAVDREAMSPIRLRERELVEAYKSECFDFERKREAYEVVKKRVLRNAKSFASGYESLANIGEPPEPPLLALLQCAEPTLEAIHKYLEHGQPSIGVVSSEGGRLIGGNAFARENQLKTLAGLSELWDGARIDRMRAGDGASVLFGRRVASHLMIQPSVASLLFGNELARDQGFMSRVLVAWPESTAGTRTYCEHSLADDPAMNRYGMRLIGLMRLAPPLADRTRNTLNPRHLPLNNEAKRVWIAFHNSCEAQLGDGGALSGIRGFGNKAAEHAARIAGVLELTEDIDAATISVDSMRSATTLTTWYLNEAVRVNDLDTIDPDVLKAEKLIAWLQSREEKEITVRLLCQYGPNAIRDAETARRVVRLLEKHNYLTRTNKSGEVWRSAI